MKPFLRRNETTTDLDRIRALAPSVFAERPASDRSDCYAFIPTSLIVKKLLDDGFAVSRIQETRSRVEGRIGFTRHMLRFRHTGLMPKVGDLVPEIVMTNSHDGSSSFQMTAGVYRLVCSNGLVAGQDKFSVRKRHSGNEHDVIDGVFSVVDEIPEVLDSVKHWSGIELTDRDRYHFARAAIPLRFNTDEHGNAPVEPGQLLAVRRSDDTGTDLLTTFNVVQENLVRGGIQAKSLTGKLRRTSAINSVSADVRLNKSLWILAEAMKNHKTGGEHESF